MMRLHGLLCAGLIVLIAGLAMSGCVAVRYESNTEAAPASSLAVMGGRTALDGLFLPMDFRSTRASSFDRSGGNGDALYSLTPGKTEVIADLSGPGVIHHIWNTVAGERYYSRKLIIRMYWDGEEDPSVEAPLGDLFAVGHGIDREVDSLPVAVTAGGRARNLYWPMPFAKSARITVTNEGLQRVGAFYYYIDWRKVPSLPAGTRYFHARYRQEKPCGEGNYVILDAKGQGHFVGTVLCVQNNAPGWWGEGDDMIYVDGETAPSLHGTGSEDYLCHSWGLAEYARPYYGCPIFEGYSKGAKTSAYRWHIEDPIPFKRSIRVTIEHGHANDRSDDFSSVAFWYQLEPHVPFGDMAEMYTRLPQEAEGEVAYTKLSAELAELEAARRWKDAAAKVEKIVSRFDKDDRRKGMLLRQAGYYRRMKDWAAEVEVYKRVAADYPHSAEAAVAAAEMWLREGVGEAPSVVVEVKRAAGPITADGLPTDAAWAGAVAVTAFSADAGATPASPPAQVRLAYDDANLYVLAEFAEPDMDRVKESIGKHDGQVWLDDAFELFLDSNRDYSTYEQFITNPRGTVWDGRGGGGAMDSDGFEPDADISVSKGADGWTVEMAVPFAELGAEPPVPGDAWRMNLRRIHRAKGERVFSWAPIEGPQHGPEKFGYLIFR